MKLYFTGLILLAGFCLKAQNPDLPLFRHNRIIETANPASFNPDWAPFYHGVASGDPTETSVIIWTRVTPETGNLDPIAGTWTIASDPELSNLVQSGNFSTDADRDFTVKIDVQNLTAGNTYYYGFKVDDKHSLTGKTKTVPVGGVDHLKFGVVSCSNYQAGFFNAYHRLADRNDLDAIIHLGDYIYEYANGVYGDSSLYTQREIEPHNEIISLEDYRTRYSTYRLDTNLIRAHQQHAFIAVWDDHESANDAYVDGAQNHDPNTEGDWNDRKSAAKKAYFEWLPIRDNAEQKVYRKIAYGDLMDLIMLDTRLEAREEQILSIQDSMLYDTNRTLLGVDQKAWLKNQLTTSNAKWKVIGQQVIFSELNVGWASAQDPNTNYYQLESLFLDIWDGYPAERTELVNFMKEEELDDVVILTGDFHSTFAFDVADPPNQKVINPVPGIGDLAFYAPSNYNSQTGEGSVAVEFATPSITSANFDENLDLLTAQIFQLQINRDINLPAGSLGNPNPHMKYTDLIQHGYFILDVKQDSVQANWYFSPINVVSNSEVFGQAWASKTGANHLSSSAESAPKAIQDVPAPYNPPGLVSTNEPNSLALLGVYPNPVKESAQIHFAITEKSDIEILVLDQQGRVVMKVNKEQTIPGIYSQLLHLNGLSKGIYWVKIMSRNQSLTTRVIKQ